MITAILHSAAWLCVLVIFWALARLAFRRPRPQAGKCRHGVPHSDDEGCSLCERAGAKDMRVADWQCTRCDALKSRLIAGTSKCRETREGYACPMVPINACGDVLPMPDLGFKTPAGYGRRYQAHLTRLD